jgi:hypothetical protein
MGCSCQKEYRVDYRRRGKKRNKKGKKGKKEKRRYN